MSWSWSSQSLLGTRNQWITVVSGTSNLTSTESTLIQALLEFLQLELGSHQNIFSLSYDSWSFLATNCWLKTLWRFLDLAQLQLKPKTAAIPPPPCQHDGSIMDDVILANLPKSTILAISHCQIAHQALYWSDVANSWGNSISPGIL